MHKLSCDDLQGHQLSASLAARQRHQSKIELFGNANRLAMLNVCIDICS